MRNKEEFTSDFMEKLNSGYFEKEIEPDVGRKDELTDEFISKELREFEKLLENHICRKQ